MAFKYHSRLKYVLNLRFCITITALHTEHNLTTPVPCSSVSFIELFKDLYRLSHHLYRGGCDVQHTFIIPEINIYTTLVKAERLF